MMIGCSFCLFFTKISILTWRDISHKSCDYSKPLYFCSNLQSNELSFFWWEITYLETTIPIISANREWWCRKIVSQGHLRTLPSEPRMDWSRPGGKTPTGFQKILCKCYIYFTLFSGQVAPLYFTKKNKKAMRVLNRVSQKLPLLVFPWKIRDDYFLKHKQDSSQRTKPQTKHTSWGKQSKQFCSGKITA